MAAYGVTYSDEKRGNGSAFLNAVDSFMGTTVTQRIYGENTLSAYEEVYRRQDLPPVASLREMGREYIRFGLANPHFYDLPLSATSCALRPAFPTMTRSLPDLTYKARLRKVLKRIARGDALYSGDDYPAEIKRAPDVLIAKGLVEKNGRGAYNFVEPMFQEHVLRMLD